jgi:N-acetylneuraminate synthase
MNAITIQGRPVGPGHPVYVVAEVSANHNHEFDQAVRIVEAAKSAGADAVKLQTYTPDSLTIASGQEYFHIQGTQWAGRTLYDLYAEAYMPWEWQPLLKSVADGLGLHLFSSAFDPAAVDFLESMNVPAHKIASFELVDLPLIEKMARTGKPLILSCGMASLDEINEAVMTARAAGAEELALLKCTSAYPSPPGAMNLRTIPELMRRFDLPVGLSDHSMDPAVAVSAVALGACMVEKHLTLSRSDGGPDSSFSLEPHEFKAMVDAVRVAEAALGRVSFEVSGDEQASRRFRRSLFVVRDVKQGEVFTRENVRSIRPGNGLHTRHLSGIISKRAARDIARGTPMAWELVEPS